MSYELFASLSAIDESLKLHSFVKNGIPLSNQNDVSNEKYKQITRSKIMIWLLVKHICDKLVRQLIRTIEQSLSKITTKYTAVRQMFIWEKTSY